jgi:nucleoside-triphosphatase THEP1
MPISPADEEILARSYRSMQEKPISPGDPYYVEIWENSPHDPVARLRKHIKWTEVESLQLFSGFSGSGKTTLLRRLQQNLEHEQYLVLYANAKDYLNLGEPIELEDLLITVAGAFSDALEALRPGSTKVSFWTTFVEWLNTIDVEVVKATVSQKVYGAIEFKAELKASETFRRKVRKVVESQLPAVQSQIESFIESSLKSVQQKEPGKRIVFLFDSFEQLRGTPSNERDILDSAERAFGRNLDKLKLPNIHCVYSVPAFLRFFSNYSELVLVPSVKLYNKRQSDGSEPRYEPGFALLRQVLEKRIGQIPLARIFGQPDRSGQIPAVEKLLIASGGALRDLLRLFREALLAAKDLPVPDRTIDQAIATARRDFLTNVEDAQWLSEIRKTQSADIESPDAADVNRYMRLLDSHLILYYINDDNWYDTHPLVRPDVDRIVAHNPRSNQPGTP